jgi:hypothetical protein
MPSAMCPLSLTLIWIGLIVTHRSPTAEVPRPPSTFDDGLQPLLLDDMVTPPPQPHRAALPITAGLIRGRAGVLGVARSRPLVAV